MRREIALVEKPVVKYAREKLKLVVIPMKMFMGSDTGIPDDLFLIPGGRPVFIEFKDPYGQSTPKQLYWRKRLRKLGYKVYVCRSKQKAIEILTEAVGAARLSEACGQVAAATQRRRPVPPARSR